MKSVAFTIENSERMKESIKVIGNATMSQHSISEFENYSLRQVYIDGENFQVELTRLIDGKIEKETF